MTDIDFSSDGNENIMAIYKYLREHNYKLALDFEYLITDMRVESAMLQEALRWCNRPLWKKLMGRM